MLVIEREREFKDRVRGEVLLPWGVGEARELGIEQLLRETCAYEPIWTDMFLGGVMIMHRDFLSTTPQGTRLLNFYHPKMQEAISNAALRAGAEIRTRWNGSVLSTKCCDFVTFDDNHEFRDGYACNNVNSSCSTQKIRFTQGVCWATAMPPNIATNSATKDKTCLVFIITPLDGAKWKP